MFLIRDTSTGKLQRTHIMTVKIEAWRCISNCPTGTKEAGKAISWKADEGALKGVA